VAGLGDQALIAWLFSQAWPYLIGLMALFGLYQRGRHDGKADAHLENLQRYHKTREATDNADLGTGASDGERIRRLREFENKR